MQYHNNYLRTKKCHTHFKGCISRNFIHLPMNLSTESFLTNKKISILYLAPITAVKKPLPETKDKH